MFKCCFLIVEATLMNIRWLKLRFQLTINVETTLSHRCWIDVILSILFQCCLVNVETTSINIRRLNFHFQPNFNVETTLVHRRWIDVSLPTLFQRCFANFETTSINVRRCNFYFQPNINVDMFAGIPPTRNALINMLKGQYTRLGKIVTKMLWYTLFCTISLIVFIFQTKSQSLYTHRLYLQSYAKVLIKRRI